MKKRAIIVLCLALVLTLVGCGNNAQSSDAHNAEYEEGYAAGYEAGYNDGKQQMTESQKHFAQFSGSFTATVAFSSRTEKGLPERMTPRTEASSSGILLKGWISQ